MDCPNKIYILGYKWAWVVSIVRGGMRGFVSSNMVINCVGLYQPSGELAGIDRMKQTSIPGLFVHGVPAAALKLCFL